jgi:hypothetical protein
LTTATNSVRYITMQTLILPNTEVVRVVYTRDETKTTQNGTLIKNPRSVSEVYRVCLFSKHIPSKNIVRLESVAPLKRAFHFARGR